MRRTNGPCADDPALQLPSLDIALALDDHLERKEKEMEGTLNVSFPFQMLYALPCKSHVALLCSPPASFPSLPVEWSTPHENFVQDAIYRSRNHHTSTRIPWTPESDAQLRSDILLFQRTGRSNLVPSAGGIDVEVCVALQQPQPQSAKRAEEKDRPHSLTMRPGRMSSGLGAPLSDARGSPMATEEEQVIEDAVGGSQRSLKSPKSPPLPSASTTPKAAAKTWTTLTCSCLNLTILPPLEEAYQCEHCSTPHFNPELMLLDACSSEQYGELFDVACFNFGNAFDHGWVVMTLKRTEGG